MKIVKEKFAKGFTPLQENGVAPKAFYLNTKPITINLRHLFISCFLTRRKKNASPSFCTGFTLIEAIVAIGVISIGFVGALVLLSKSSEQSSILRNRLIAAHLAEEGIEVVVNIRDTNWLRDLAWRNGLADTNFSLLNYNSSSLDTSADVTSRDCLNYSGGFYVHPAVALTCSTPFKRHIELSTGLADPDLGGAQPLIIKSVVSWTERAQTQTMTVTDYLYDWK